MKWKNCLWVFDNIVPETHQETIKNTLMGTSFPWYFTPDITGGGSKDMRPGFSHNFIRDESVTSKDYISLLEPVWYNSLNKLNEKIQESNNYSIVKSRTFLQLPLNGLTGSRVDAHHIDRIEPHFVFLYYVCDSDGPTVIYNQMYSQQNPVPPEPKRLTVKKKVMPKQGRVVIFDGHYWHTGTQPTKHTRCMVNTNLIQK